MDERESAALPDAAVNVAGVYAALRDDIRRNTRHTTGFDHAVRLTRLMNDVLASSADGARREAQGWPGMDGEGAQPRPSGA